MNFVRSSLRRLQNASDESSHSHPRSRYSGEDYELLSSSEVSGSPTSSSPGLPLPNGTIPTSSSPTSSPNTTHGHRRRQPSVNYSGGKLGILAACSRSLALHRLHCFTLKRLLIAALVIPVLLVLGILWSGIPPNYEDVRGFERRLPQHNVTAAREAGIKYLRFPGHLWGHGLNNILQEAILMNYIAYSSQRAYVFEDYIWSQVPFPYTIYDFALRPARIPLNAFISGATAGGEVGGDGPRSVTAEFWEEVCPREARVSLSAFDAPLETSDGETLIKWWVDRLKDIETPCVEVDTTEKQVFDFKIFGSSRLLTLWPGLSTSPILTSFAWSPLVQSAVSRNFALLQPSSLSTFYDLQRPSAPSLPGLLAVHLRRGDYSRHCPRLARQRKIFHALNQFPSYPDRFTPEPMFNDTSISEHDIEDYYIEHCYPSHEQIVLKLRQVRKENPGDRKSVV